MKRSGLCVDNIIQKKTQHKKKSEITKTDKMMNKK